MENKIKNSCNRRGCYIIYLPTDFKVKPQFTKMKKIKVLNDEKYKNI